MQGTGGREAVRAWGAHLEMWGDSRWGSKWVSYGYYTDTTAKAGQFLFNYLLEMKQGDSHKDNSQFVNRNLQARRGYSKTYLK